MEPALNRRLLVAWLVLVGIALSYLWLDSGSGGAVKASAAVTVIAIGLALLKVRIVMREFMEVRSSPRQLCRITDLLLLVMAAAMIGSYVAGRLAA